MFREEAITNQKAARQKRGKTGLGESTRTKSTRSQLAEVAKVSEEKAKQVIKLSNEDPELLAKVKAGEKKLTEAVHDLDETNANLIDEINRLHKEISGTTRTAIKLPKPIEHWRLTKKVETVFGRFIEGFLTKIEPSQHRESLRLISDDCAARIEKLESKQPGRD